MNSAPRAFWSVTPNQTSSPYVRNIATALEALGWDVAQLSVRDLASSQEQIIHIQWPEHVSRGPGTARTVAKHLRALALLEVLKRRRHRVVVTAHNLAPHGASDAFDEWFRAQILTLAKAVIVLVPAHEKQLRLSGQIASHTIVHSIRHPVDEVAATGPVSAERQSLLILGRIDPYHRILEFVDALIELGNTREVKIVGQVGDTELVDSLSLRARNTPWLHVHAGYASDQELASVVDRTAAVVSLQRTPFNSGGPYFALPRNIPAVLTAGAQARDIEDKVGSDWVFEVPQSENQLDLAKFEAWLRRDRSQPDLGLFTAAAVAEAHIEVYRTLLSKENQLPKE